jgi:hypothetical protein
LIEFGITTRQREQEVNTNLEAIQREVRQRFEEGKNKGETEVEITSRLVWLERQKYYALYCGMKQIFRTAADALDRATEISPKTPKLLKWQKPRH